MKQFGCFRLDEKNACLWRDAQMLPLTPKPFALLRYLVEHPQQLITHDELLDALWPETFVQPQVLRTYILELRRLLGDDRDEPRYIQTVQRRGYRFLAEVHDAPTSNLPGRGKQVFGREAELATLRHCLECASRGERQIIFLAGDAGIGKTALVEAFCAEARLNESVQIGWGQSVEGFAGKEPFYAIREALGLLASGEQGEMRSALKRFIADATGKQPLLSEFCETIEGLTQKNPVILVLEDLHWADASTLDLISALARRKTKAKFLLLATCSPTGMITAESPRQLKQDLLTRKLATRIDLGPLDKEAAGKCVKRALGSENLPKGLTSFLHQHSEGNPLFLESALEHLQQQKLLSTDCGELRLTVPLAELRLGVPDGIAGMIELQLERLSREERRLLEASAAAGTVFPAWATAAALDISVAEVEEQCEALARGSRLIANAGQDELPGGARSSFYVFCHSFYREALYNGASASLRARCHLRIAERLRELFAGREADVALELAAHYEAAGVPAP